MNSKKSLRNGINMIFLSVWLIIFVLQIIYIYTLYRKTVNDTQIQFYSCMDSTYGILEKKINTGKQIAKFISNDSLTFSFFQCNDAQQCQILWNSIITPVKNTYDITSERFYALCFNNEQELIASSDDADLQLIHAARDALGAFKLNTENINFYTTSNSPFSNMLFFSFYDIKLPDINSVGTKHIGTIVVAGKVNTEELLRQSGLSRQVRLSLRNDKSEENNIILTQGLSDEQQLFWERNISSTKWYLCGSSNVETPISTGIILLIAETGFMTILFVLMQKFVKRSIFVPLYKISDFLEDYSITKKNKRIDLKNQTEIGNVADKIDKMVDDIEQLSHRIIQTQQKLYESEIAQKDAKLYALQAQLNPHFMYNTLDCICGIANISNVPLIPDITVALAKMLRYNLSEGSDVPLSREIELIKNYLTIMEIRRPDCFTAEFHISAEAENLLCPKMLLQPIVENIFMHGFDDYYIQDAHIIISAESKNDCLLITIFDDGCGIPKEKQASVIHSLETDDYSFYFSTDGSNHIGLLNIQNRIKLEYGNDFGLNIESEEGEFTKVTLKLPIIVNTTPNREGLD